MAIKQAKVITITSVKGGTGKTTLTLALAGLLSQKNKKTIIVDMDLHTGVIAPSLNLKYDKDFYTLTSDIMNHQFKTLENYTLHYNEYIDVLPAPKDPRNVAKIATSYIDIILKKLKYIYDVILIDTNHIIDNINLVTYDNSDNIIYVLNHDLMALKNMKTMLAIYDDMKLSKYTLVLNSIFNDTNIQKKDITDYLGVHINYVISKNFYEKKLTSCLMKGKIFNLEKQYQKENSILNKLLDDILK